MDMYGSSYQPNPNQPYRSRRSARMEAASLILGSIALLSCTCLYLAVPCGALAVIFATLSRGGMMSYTSKAQIGMILGIMALVAAIGLYASVLGYAIHQYGSIDGFLKAYSDMLHLSVSCCAVWGAGGYFCNTFPRRHDVLYFESTDRNDSGDYGIGCGYRTVRIGSGVCHPSVWKYRWIFKGLF